MSKETPFPGEMPEKELERYSIAFKDYCKRIQELLANPTPELTQELPNFQQADELYRRMAQVVELAAGHGFDVIINPLAGTNITATIAYATHPLTHIITIDSGEAFAMGLPEGDEIRRIISSLESIPQGYAFGNVGLPAYATELALHGVNFDMLRVTSREQFQNSHETTLEFALPDGRKIRHSNFGNFTLSANLSDLQTDLFLKQELGKMLTPVNQLLFLSKAGVYTGVRPLTEYMRKDTIIVVDTGSEARELAADLKIKGNGLINIKTSAITSELRTIEGSYAQSSGRKARYGYVRRISELGIYKVK